MEEMWRKEVIIFVNRINNGEEWRIRLEREWERVGMSGDVVAGDISAPPVHVATSGDQDNMSVDCRHKKFKNQKSKIIHGKTCAKQDNWRECLVAKELTKEEGGSKEEGDANCEESGREDQKEAHPKEWDPEDLLSMLETIGAVKHMPAHPRRKEMIKTARENWSRGRCVCGTEVVNDTNPEAWLAKDFKVDFGDGSAKEVVRFRSLKDSTRSGKWAAERRGQRKGACSEAGKTLPNTPKGKSQRSGNVGTGVYCMSDTVINLMQPSGYHQAA